MEEDWGVCAVEATIRPPRKTAGLERFERAPEKRLDLVTAPFSAHAAVSLPAALHALEYASEPEIHPRF